jgi:hypothetical protein
MTSPKRRSASRAVVQPHNRVQAKPFPDIKLLGAQFGEVALVPSGMIAKLDDLVCGRVHVFSQRHGAMVFHGGEPPHNQIREALPANCVLPQDRGVAVWASDDRFHRASTAERASVA